MRNTPKPCELGLVTLHCTVRGKKGAQPSAPGHKANRDFQSHLFNPGVLGLSVQGVMVSQGLWVPQAHKLEAEEKCGGGSSTFQARMLCGRSASRWSRASLRSDSEDREVKGPVSQVPIASITGQMGVGEGASRKAGLARSGQERGWVGRQRPSPGPRTLCCSVGDVWSGSVLCSKQQKVLKFQEAHREEGAPTHPSPTPSAPLLGRSACQVLGIRPDGALAGSGYLLTPSAFSVRHPSCRWFRNGPKSCASSCSTAHSTSLWTSLPTKVRTQRCSNKQRGGGPSASSEMGSMTLRPPGGSK